MHRLDRRGFALRLGPHADAELLLLRPDSGPRPSDRRRRAAAGRTKLAGCAGLRSKASRRSSSSGTSRPDEVQHQFVALEGRASDGPSQVTRAVLLLAVEVPEGPVAVEHLQHAADVASTDRETC